MPKSCASATESLLLQVAAAKIGDVRSDNGVCRKSDEE